MGTMRGGVCHQLKTPFITAIVFLIVICSLLTLDTLLRSGETDTDVRISTQKPEQAPVTVVKLVPAPAGLPPSEPSLETPAPEISSPEVPISEFLTPETLSTNPSEPRPISTRPLILYAYADSEEGTSLVNLKYFIKHGLHGVADFIFILNGETNVASLIPVEDNIRVVQRPNDCYDLGAHAEVLTTCDLYKEYTKFILMNASIRGPFIPYWSSSCSSDLYLSKLTEEVKLVGMTANCWPSFHIQSMIWAIDLIGLTTLLFPPSSALAYLSTHPILVPAPKTKNKTPISPSTDQIPPPTFHLPGINSCFHSWDTAVAAEISSTALIRAAGFKVDAMMAAYHGMGQYEREESCEVNRDVLFEGEYFGGDVHPFETVFMKSNRDVDPGGLERHSQWMKGRGYRSYDYCK